MGLRRLFFILILLLWIFHGRVVLAANDVVVKVASANGVNLRSGPGVSNSVILAVPRNYKVHIQDSKNGWYKVKVYAAENPNIKNDFEGWMTQSAFSTEVSAQVQTGISALERNSKPTGICKPNSTAQREPVSVSTATRSLPKYLSPSDTALEMVASVEGFEDEIYDDLGHPAIGFGHRLLPGEMEKYRGKKISRAEGLRLLKEDMEKKARHVRARLADVPMTQAEFDTLVSFHYNQAADRFNSNSYFFRQLQNAKSESDPGRKDEHYRNAFAGLLVYDRAAGVPSKGLRKRRTTEVYYANHGMRLDPDRDQAKLSQHYNKVFSEISDKEFVQLFGRRRWD